MEARPSPPEAEASPGVTGARPTLGARGGRESVEAAADPSDTGLEADTLAVGREERLGAGQRVDPRLLTQARTGLRAQRPVRPSLPWLASCTLTSGSGTRS